MNADEISIVEPRGVYTKLSRLLRMVRMREQLTQQELASRSGVSYASISRMERGSKIATDALMRIFSALGLLDSFDEYLEGRLRLAKFPKTLVDEERAEYDERRSAAMRVRHRSDGC